EALPLVGGEAGPLEPDPLAATIDGESLFDDPPPDDDRVWDDGPARSTGWGARVVAAAGSAALTAAALTWLGPAPAVRPGVVAAAAAAAALLLPRLAWLAAAGAIVTWLALGTADGGAGAPGLALLVGLAALPTALLLRGAAGAWWSTPALAPVLGAAGIAGAWPAVAGQAARPW